MTKTRGPAEQYQLLSRSPDGIVLVRENRRVGFVNPAWRVYLGMRGTKLVGRKAHKVLDRELMGLVDAALEGESIGEVTFVRGPFELSVQPVRLKGSGVMLVAHDITRWRKAERLRSDFVANVSHELRTPMASIMGYAETLANEPERLDDDVLLLVQAIYRNSKRLRDLFEDLLHLSRIEARAREFPMTKVALRPLLAEALVNAADRAAQKNQVFELLCKKKARAWVNAEALSAIVANLASNAVTYTAEGGRIAVRVTEDDDEHCVIEVADNGIGIDPSQRARIFERFYRVDPGRSRQAGGTGLGLAIVKHLALASRCRITIDGALGEGTTFRIKLPRQGVPGFVPTAKEPDDELDSQE